MKRTIKLALLACLILLVGALMFTACDIGAMLPSLTETTPSNNEQTTPEVTTPAPHVHTEVIVPAVAPTCNASGLTEGKHCSVCNEVLVEQTVVDALDHAEFTSKAVTPPTATTEGYTTYTCSACDNTYTKAIFTIDFTISNSNFSMVGCTEEDGTLIVPAVFENAKIWYRIRSIGKQAFSSCSGLTSITIPDSVTSIGEKAFYGCNSLTSITIPNSVTSIGEWAFSGCNNLTNVHISDLTAWCNIDFVSGGDNPLSKAQNLYLNGELITELVIPDGVTKIGSYAFANYSNLTSVTITNSVTSIGAGSFYNCRSLTSITIPHSVTNIGRRAFSSCHSLTNIIIPNSVTSIGQEAFSNCTSLTSITIPSSITSIGEKSFLYCISLTSITIPHGVTNIGNYAFDSCKALTIITIPNSVTSIGEEAFSGCKKLTDVHITDIAAWCNIDFANSFATPLCYAENLYLNNELITELVIPDGTTRIGNYAFYGLDQLTSITIPDSVTSIGDYACYGCHSVTSITIPDNVTSIGHYAFWYCSNLMGIELPDSVTSIGLSAFGHCGKLAYIAIPNSVTYIGIEAFFYCSNLTYITFGGTKSQWQAISIGKGWNSHTGNYTIYCTDGTISK